MSAVMHECPCCDGSVPVGYQTPSETKCPQCGATLVAYWDEDGDGNTWRGLECAACYNAPCTCAKTP